MKRIKKPCQLEKEFFGRHLVTGEPEKEEIAEGPKNIEEDPIQVLSDSPSREEVARVFKKFLQDLPPLDEYLFRVYKTREVRQGY